MMRTKPYTARGIRRKACLRCGHPARHQWNVCALGRQYLPICLPCDIGLNREVLRFMRIDDAEPIGDRYEAEQRAKYPNDE